MMTEYPRNVELPALVFLLNKYSTRRIAYKDVLFGQFIDIDPKIAARCRMWQKRFEIVSLAARYTIV